MVFHFKIRKIIRLFFEEMGGILIILKLMQSSTNYSQIFQEAVPSSSLAFPKFTPEILE